MGEKVDTHLNYSARLCTQPHLNPTIQILHLKFGIQTNIRAEWNIQWDLEIRISLNLDFDHLFDTLIEEPVSKENEKSKIQFS